MTLAQRVGAFLNPTKASEVIAEKAMTGPGAWVMENHMPLSSGRRDPQKFMTQAQAISRRNPWVNTAEAIICGKASTVPWHLEDKNAESIDPFNPGSALAQQLIRLIERPNEQMTRSRLWNITLRHMGVCGNAYWYLDQRDRLAGIPLAIYYINPARMRPATDAKGNLTGWILDAEDTYEFDAGRQTGIGLDLKEVIQFTLEPPDWGYLGHGLVESAEGLLGLNSAAERYLTQVMATGGRRGHFIGPKDGRMDDDVFQSLVAGLRNVAESPDAAKRNIVTKGPIFAQPQAVTPNEVGAMGVLTEMREDIVSGVWRVPLSSLGIPLPAGLNSGESRKYDEASLWQNAIDPRAKSFAETLQFQLIDRTQKAGLELNIVLELPQFDDATPAWDLIGKSENAPVTWNEQRALIGLDPLPDYDPTGAPLGLRITMPQTIVTVAAAADAHGNFGEITVTPPDRPLIDAPVKAAPLGKLRDRLEQSRTPKIAEAVGTFLEAQRSEIIGHLRAKIGHLLRKPTDTSWWSRHWDDALAKVMAPHLEAITVDVAAEVGSTLGKPHKSFISDTEEFVQTRSGERITGINATTREAILVELRLALEEAVEAGMGPGAAADLVGERVKGLAVWNEARRDLISRTELMLAYNDAALKSYEHHEVRYVEALDGDKDDECASRNGREYLIEDAYSIADHPNGTLDWAPIVGRREERGDFAESRSGKAEAMSSIDAMTVALRAVAQPPTVNFPPPIVNMPEIIIPPAAPVDMTPVAEALFAIRDDQRAEMTKLTTTLTRPKRLVRDPDGHIVGIEL